MKIIDTLQNALATQTPCLSFEYYPPRDRDKWPNFYEKIGRMSRLHPNFIDVTWGTGDPTSLATLEISRNIQAQTGIDTMMHFTCTHRSKSELMEILEQVRTETGIRNIMALRGNRTPDAAWEPHPYGFKNAAELIASIRAHFGYVFCISAAAYPEGHREDGLPPSPDFVGTPEYYAQIAYLRAKVDAGADFLVTQLCFDLEQLCRFRDDCVKAGITCPIVPGILPIHSQQTWEKIAHFSASIPQKLAKRYEAVDKSDASQFEAFAANLLHEQMSFLHAEGFWAIHLYTLNYEKLISRALSIHSSAPSI